MKIKDGFILRDVGGKTFVVAVGELSKTFCKMITLNETGKIIWQCLTEGKNADETADKILSVYEGATREGVMGDVEAFISKLREEGILDE